MKIFALLYLGLTTALVSAQEPSTLRITQCIEHQLHDYPCSTMQDIYKFFYQDFFGPEHMITDSASVKNYLQYELSQPTVKLNDTYYYPLDYNKNYVRVNLNTISDGLLTADQFLNAFIESANSNTKVAQCDWAEVWDTIAIIAIECGVNTNYEELVTLIQASKLRKPVHHSKIYNQTYHPHYRLVENTLFQQNLLPLLK